MIRHVVLFKLKPDVSAEDRARWLAQSRVMPAQMDFLRDFSIGEDQLHLPRSYDVALVADFDSLDDVKVYADHPAHVPVAQLGRQLSEHVCSVDFEV